MLHMIYRYDLQYMLDGQAYCMYRVYVWRSSGCIPCNWVFCGGNILQITTIQNFEGRNFASIGCIIILNNAINFKRNFFVDSCQSTKFMKISTSLCWTDVGFCLGYKCSWLLCSKNSTYTAYVWFICNNRVFVYYRICMWRPFQCVWISRITRILLSF